MPGRHHRMPKCHARAGVTHRGPDSLTHLRSIAVDVTARTRRLAVSEGARGEAFPGILREFRALAAERVVGAAVFPAAVDQQHCEKRPLSAFTSCFLGMHGLGRHLGREDRAPVVGCI